MLPRKIPVGIALFWTAGTFAGLLVEDCFVFAVCAVAVLLLISSCLWALRRATVVSGLLLLVCCGLTGLAVSQYHQMRRWPPGLSLQPGGTVDILAAVSGESQPLRIGGQKQEWAVPVRAVAVRKAGAAWVPWGMEGSARWHCSPGGTVPGYGERWEFRAVIPLRQDRRAALLRPRRALTFHASYGNAVRVGDDDGSAFQSFCLKGRQGASALLGRGVERFTDEVAVIRSLMLGYRNVIPRAVMSMSALTGTLHIFAISGQHVAIICGLIVVLLRALRVPMLRWMWFLGPLLVGYTVGTGGSPSAVRACVMALVYMAAPILGRRPDIGSAAAVSAVLMLAWDPFQLMDWGFVLSYAVVIGLIVLLPLFSLSGIGAAGETSALDELEQRVTGRGRFRAAVRRMLFPLLAVAVAAWVVSAPLTAYIFGRFTPIALVANLVIVPLSFLMLLSGSCAIVAGACFPLAAEIFNYASVVLVKLCVFCMKWLILIPWGNIDVERGNAVWLVAGYGAVLTLTLARYAWRWRREVPVEAPDLDP